MEFLQSISYEEECSGGCKWADFEDFLVHGKWLTKDNREQLKQFYYNRFFQLVKMFPRDYCTPQYINAIHYCICSGRDFYTKLNPFKFTIIEKSNSKIDFRLMLRIEDLCSLTDRV